MDIQITEKWTYNGRLPPTQIDVELPSQLPQFEGINCFDSNQPNCSAVSGLIAANNGNVQAQIVNRSGPGPTINYTYDSLNRLIAGVQGGTSPWTQNFAYDQWGNRALTGHSGTTPSPTGEGPQATSAFNSSNKITAFTYDQAGNVTNFAGVRTATYDAENRQTLARPSNNEPTIYAYDGEGRRIKKTTCPAGTGTCTAAVPGAVTTTFVVWSKNLKQPESCKIAAHEKRPLASVTGLRDRLSQPGIALAERVFGG